jgi:hypothetical protein
MINQQPIYYNPGPAATQTANVIGITSANIWPYLRSQNGSVIVVDQYIDSNDRSDSAGIAAAVAAAGNYGTLLFTAGRTYRYDRVIVPQLGQTFEGNGATLKKIDKIATTLTKQVVSGQTAFTITVASAAKFYVGMQINFYTSAWAAAALADAYTGNSQLAFCEQGNYTITAINGNVISVTGSTLQNTYPIGTNVIASCSLFVGDGQSVNVKNVTIRNFTIDGNKDSYAGTFNNWVAHCEIRIDGDGTRVENVTINNALCEGMIVGGAGSIYENINGVNTNGNLFHLTGSATAGSESGTVIQNCYGRANSIGFAAGLSGLHQAGMISISSPVPSFIIQNMVCEGLADDGTTSATPRFIGNINKLTSSLRINNVLIRNTGNGASGARTYPAFDFSVSMDANMVGLSISDVTMIDSGNFTISENSGTAVFTRVDIDNVKITLGNFRVNRISNFSIGNITVDNSTPLVTPNTGISIGVCQSGRFYNLSTNSGNGAVTALIIEGACTDVTIDSGLVQEGSQCVRVGVAGTRCTIQGMKTRQTSGVSAANGYGFVLAAQGWNLKNCEVQSNIASGGSTTGVLVNYDNSGTAGTKANAGVIDGCTIRMADALRGSINVSGAQAWNTVVTNCNVTAAITDTGTSTVKANNTTILSYAP